MSSARSTPSAPRARALRREGFTAPRGDGATLRGRRGGRRARRPALRGLPLRRAPSGPRLGAAGDLLRRLSPAGPDTHFSAPTPGGGESVPGVPHAGRRRRRAGRPSRRTGSPGRGAGREGTARLRHRADPSDEPAPVPVPRGPRVERRRSWRRRRSPAGRSGADRARAARRRGARSSTPSSGRSSPRSSTASTRPARRSGAASRARTPTTTSSTPTRSSPGRTARSSCRESSS